MGVQLEQSIYKVFGCFIPVLLLHIHTSQPGEWNWRSGRKSGQPPTGHSLKWHRAFIVKEILVNYLVFMTQYDRLSGNIFFPFLFFEFYPKLTFWCIDFYCVIVNSPIKSSLHIQWVCGSYQSIFYKNSAMQTWEGKWSIEIINPLSFHCLWGIFHWQLLLSLPPLLSYKYKCYWLNA